jgi:hypothetical protein
MAGPPGAGSGGSGGSATLKAYFKTPEGRHKLQYEKTHSAVPHYGHGGRTVSQVRHGTAANCGERAACGGSPFSGGPGPVVRLTLYGWIVWGGGFSDPLR